MNFKSSSGNHKKVGCFYCSIGDNVHLDVQYCESVLLCKDHNVFFPPMALRRTNCQRKDILTWEQKNKGDGGPKTHIPFVKFTGSCKTFLKTHFQKQNRWW